MRQNKYSMFITGLITTISIILAVCFNSCNKEFATNLLLGIFASGLVTFIISTIYFTNERFRTLRNLKSQILKLYNLYLRYSREEEIKPKINAVLTNIEYDYTEFELVIDDLSFLLFNKRRKENINKYIYKVAQDAKMQFALNSYNIYIHRENAEKGLDDIKKEIALLDAYFIEKIESTVSNGHGGVFEHTQVRNKVSDKLMKEMEELNKTLCFYKNRCEDDLS